MKSRVPEERRRAASGHPAHSGGTIKKEWAKLRYLPASRLEAWDAFRPER